MIYRNVIVDGDPVDEYFVREEAAYFECGSELVILTTNVPSENEQSDDFATVKSLLHDMRLVC